jgi:hypothetical protein
VVRIGLDFSTAFSGILRVRHSRAAIEIRVPVARVIAFMHLFPHRAAATAALGFALLAFAPLLQASPARDAVLPPTTLSRSTYLQVAQSPAPSTQQQTPAAVQNGAIGTVASLTGSATLTRNNATSPLKLKDEIFSGDTLRTGANATLSVTLDDETTFNLGANATLVMNSLVYQSGGASNASLFNVVRGTVAFVAGQVARTGNMQIDTPTATLGIRGTTGLIEVPDNPRTPGDVAIKLYNDADGHLGRIEVFGVGQNAGQRLGVLDRAASGFAIRPGAGGRFAAFALEISPQQAARDRGFVGRLFRDHNVGRRLMIERRNFRQQNFQRAPGQQRGQKLRNPDRQNRQLRGPEPRQRATSPQLQRSRGAAHPNSPPTRRRPYDETIRPAAAPRGAGSVPFRSAPPAREFNRQRSR